MTNLSPAPSLLRPVVGAPRSPLWGRLVVITIGFTLLNILFMPVTMTAGLVARPTDISLCLICFFLGAIGAEPGLLAIAAVFGTGTPWRRHLVAVFLVLMLAISGAAGIFLTERMFPIRLGFGGHVMWTFTLLSPILFYACQLPLWLFRGLFCWRIASQHCASEKVPRLSIAGILSATAAIALALGAVRLGRECLSFVVGNQIDSNMWWLLTGTWAIVISTISLAALPMFTAAVFRMRSPLLGVVGAAAWSALVFEVAIKITRMVYGGWPFPYPWYWLASIVAGFTVGLAVPLLIVRLHSYRLLWGKKGS